MSNIMLDIETLSNTVNSAVIQVSLVKFDWDKDCQNPEKLQLNLHVDEQIKKGLDINSDTLAWWLDTNPELLKTILKHNGSVEFALTEIQNFITLDDCIWCHATFDVPILANLFNKFNKRLPWKYIRVRDIRTLIDLAELDLSQYDWKNEKTHDSLDDCMFQIKYCKDAMKKLKGV